MTSTSPQPSTSSVKALSVRSNNRPSPSLISTVVTVPPWAKDEPPSPTELPTTGDAHPAANEPHISDVASFHSQHNANGPLSRWWAFTLPRPRDAQNPEPQSGLVKAEQRKSLTFKDRSKSWLPASALREVPASFSRRNGEKSPDEGEAASRSNRRNWNLSITMPTPTAAPFTVAQTGTPGWETPWTSRPAAQGPYRSHSRHSSYGLHAAEEDTESNNKDASSWAKRKKRLRIFILNNTYVPLLFRFINISFTTAALGVAIRIRLTERTYGLMGAVGSSPTLVIIFAPLTLVHVISAIYLEYFGRPLGLWRTSGKLAHTLSEVLFICAWSAALSLCFDNFFTSLVPCASNGATAWYNQLPRPASNLPTFEGSIGDKLCDSQLALICLVAVGLVMYCTNLVISLFRIFEKVKYHPAHAPFGFHPT